MRFSTKNIVLFNRFCTAPYHSILFNCYC